jgi:Xaa-Pro aminopeptidase
MVWANERPPRPANPIFHLAEEYSGESVSSKLNRLRERLAKAGSPGTVITNLDEVAWLFNLRGTDIPYNPVFFAYAIVTPHDCTLFCQAASVSQEIRDYLQANRVAFLDYSQVWTALESWREMLNVEKKAAEEKKKQEAEAAAAAPAPEAPPAPSSKTEENAKPAAEETEKIVKTDKVIIGNRTSWAVANALGEDNVDVRRSLVETAKARKNATEIEGFRRCHVRDGAALVRYFSWLEEVLGKGETWNEFDAAGQLEKFRS